MLDTQLDFQTKILGQPLDNYTEEERIEFIRLHVFALEDELHELMGEIGWKPWATSKHINLNATKNELVDAWHFFMNLMLILGMDADELNNRYNAKQKKNRKRQTDGYDGVSTKCPGCKRALDDDEVACGVLLWDANIIRCGLDGRLYSATEVVIDVPMTNLKDTL